MVSTAVFNFRSKFDNFIYCGYYRSLVTDIVRLTVYDMISIYRCSIRTLIDFAPETRTGPLNMSEKIEKIN